MRRRDLILVIGAGAVASSPISALAQPEKIFHLGILANEHSPYLDELLKALRERGYVEGKNLRVEWRFAHGMPERWPELARELVALKIDVAVVDTTPAALALKHATQTIPIVIPTAIDPVGAGLAESLARPGGNVTGLSIMSPEMSIKSLSLLKEAVPGLSRVAVLWNGGNPAFVPVWRALDSGAGALGVTLSSQQVRELQDFDTAFAAISNQRPDGLLLLPDALTLLLMPQIIAFARRERLPAITSFPPFARQGGLMSYGPSVDDVMRGGADYIDRILKGQNPATLPFEQPTKFELVINLKTADSLGLTVPQLLLVQADEVIQ